MKSEEDIIAKSEELDMKALETAKESHKSDCDIEPVNRGAVYGWNEALKWVLQGDQE